MKGKLEKIPGWPFGLDEYKFYVEKVIGVVVVRVKRKDATDFLHGHVLTFSHDTAEWGDICGDDLNRSDEIAGVVPTHDCYRVFGLNETTDEFVPLGCICGKATRLDWEKERQEMIKRSKERMKK